MISKERVVNTTNGWSVELRTAKTGTPVSCPIPNELAKHILELDGTTPFWSGKSDAEHATYNWRKIYARVFKAAGVNGHPHMFRHTFAKRLLSQGIPTGYVASLLGNTEKIVHKHHAKWIVERQTAVDKAVRSLWSQSNHVTPALHSRHGTTRTRINKG
jgi:integrase